MNDFQRIIQCIFDGKRAPNSDEKFYYVLVAYSLGIMMNRDIILSSFIEHKDGREIVFSYYENKYYLFHSWKKYGSSIKPVTIWLNKNLGRFSIWDISNFGAVDTGFTGPWSYAEDLYDVYKKEFEEQ